MWVSFLSVGAGQLAARSLWFTPLVAGWRVEIAGPVEVHGRVWLPGTGRIRIGRGVVLIGRRAPVELRAHEGGEIVIEDGVVIDDGASIEATRSVRICARARLGAFCKVMDNNFHRTTNLHERPASVPITIGREAIVGPRAVLLPGADLGDGARLGPLQVLSFRLPAGAQFPGPGGAT
jgi:acetyltransferase-like isoleucine patch superfamily enzyme